MSRPSAAAIERAGLPAAYALRTLYGLDGSTVDEAARKAWTPTGPTLEVIVERIRQLREDALLLAS